MRIKPLVISLTIVFCVLASSSSFAQEDTKYQFSPKAYTTDLDDEGDDDAQTIDEDDNDPVSHLMDRKKKKGKKGKKKKPLANNNSQKGNGISTDSSDTNSGPPPFPCDLPLCVILDPILPPEVCQNQCTAGNICQGRHDMRIGHFNIATCVPLQMGPAEDGGGM